MFDEAWVEVSGGNLIRLPELSARLLIGEKGNVSAYAPFAAQRDSWSMIWFSGYPSASHVNCTRNFRFPTGWHAAKCYRHCGLREAYCACSSMACH